MKKQRKILFRGIEVNNTKCPDRNGHWVYGYLVCKNRIGNASEFRGTYEVDPETISQFIGLVDITGYEIFEGATIEFTKGDVKSLHTPKKVVYDDHNACFVLEEADKSNLKNAGLIMGISSLTVERYGIKVIR